MPNTTYLQRWASWLRANAHRQTRGAFRRRLGDGTVLVCAIGALEEVPPTGRHLFSMTCEQVYLKHVVSMNDTFGWSFPEIAAWLDRVAAGDVPLREALAIRHVEQLRRFEDRGVATVTASPLAEAAPSSK